MIKDYRSVELPERLKAMISYAFELTKTPWEMKEEDVFSLKNTGFSDADILAINLIISYFNFVNRIALGLGVEFTGDEVTGYRY
ncbi:MAG: peroxidase [Thermoplasmata archaeon]|nr:MAG: peroxidase [Thermoplasmata archaeon]